MRLVIATPLYPPEIGGPATYSKLLAEGLPRKGIEVELAKFSAVRHLPKPIRYIAYFFRVARALNAADAIFAQDVVSVGLPSALAAFLLRKPFLVRVPGDHAWEQARQRFGVTDSIDAFQTKRYGFRAEAMRRAQRFVVHRARYVVVPSEYFGRLVRGWGVRAERVRVIYNGIEALAPAEPGSVQRPLIFSAGRLVPWKGFDFLIRLLPTLPAWHLSIAGGGPERSALEALATSLKLQDRVRFLGDIARAEVAGWCAAADAFVLASTFESFSFQIAEALGVGAAIVATNIGSIPELVENGKEGVLLTPGDADGFRAAIESTQIKPAEWSARREVAREKSKHFSIENTLNAVESLLKTI